MVTEVVKIILQNKYRDVKIPDEFWKNKNNQSIYQDSKKIFPSILKLSKKYPINQIKEAAINYRKENFLYPYFEAIVKDLYEKRLNKEKIFNIKNIDNKKIQYKFEKPTKSSLIDYLKGLQNGKR